MQRDPDPGYERERDDSRYEKRDRNKGCQTTAATKLPPRILPETRRRNATNENRKSAGPPQRPSAGTIESLSPMWASEVFTPKAKRTIPVLDDDWNDD